MAKMVSGGQSIRYVKSKIRRPGVVSKNRTSRLKGSKIYRKAYRGQGRV